MQTLPWMYLETCTPIDIQGRGGRGRGNGALHLCFHCCKSMIHHQILTKYDIKISHITRHLDFFFRITLCSSRKYPYPPHGRSMEIPRGWGVLKAKILKGKYEAYLEFPEGWGDSNQKTFCGRGMDIFWNNTLENSILS